MKIKLADIINILGGKTTVNGAQDLLEKNITRVITDTRVFKDGENYDDAVFVALCGEKFDANEFIYDAAKRGVALVVTNRDDVQIQDNKTWFVRVDDTLATLGIIAKAHRQKFSPKTVGITGSVGKTTTKEMIFHVLSENFKTLKTEASFNNEIGVPRTLMTLDESHEALVVEMGMRGFNQVDFLAGCSLPELGVITNIGCAHLELMGTKENTLKAKLEIAKYAKTLILNGDDALLTDEKKVGAILSEYGVKPEIEYFGLGENCNVRGVIKDMTAEASVFTVYVNGSELFDVKLSAPGVHSVSAALSAIAVATRFGIAPEKIKQALESFRSEQTGRQKIEKYGEYTVIDDCFNAGPESMKASISLLKALPAKRRVAFLGDMLELGDVSRDEHRGVGIFAAKNGVDLLITVGERSKELGLSAAKAEKGTQVVALDNSSDAAEAVSELLRPGDVILVKGSHAMDMGKIVESVRNLSK